MRYQARVVRRLRVTSDVRQQSLYAVTLFTGSFLLFLLEPMIARMALPRLGGTPAVWNSALAVFQLLLLGGYCYAHLLGKLAPRVQRTLHLAALGCAAVWLPISLGQRQLPSSTPPVLWVPWLFASAIGPLFFTVAAQAPLLQRWYSLAAPGRNPYWLYAASSLGSFAGLIAYPVLVEPLLGLSDQGRLWTSGYLLLAGLVALCGWHLPKSAERTLGVAGSAPVLGTRLRWIALAAVPSGLILSTTTHLATDIVAVPLLWVVPLGLYLLSFLFAFSERGRVAPLVVRFYPIVLILAATTSFLEGQGTTGPAIASALITLLASSISLHRRLYLARPDQTHITGFYLMIAFGGATGGLFCALVAPIIFDWAYEQPLLIVGAAFLGARRRPPTAFMEPLWSREQRTKTTKIIVAGIIILSVYASGLAVSTAPLLVRLATTLLMALAVAGIGRPLLFGLSVAAVVMSAGGWEALRISTQLHARERSYFSIYTIADRNRTRELISGTTLHGVQRLTPGEERLPTSYYASDSGIGRALTAAPALYGRSARIGVVGLGTGTLACYAQSGQTWRFYEIDPTVVAIATDRRRFTFLSRCAPQARILVGDARVTLAREPAASYDILAIDAFSSDAVPMHLLTIEAMNVYARATTRDGILMMHVSNRFLDLRPIIAAAAEARGWHAAIRDYVPDPQAISQGASRSLWIALSRNDDMLRRLVNAGESRPGDWTDLRHDPEIPAWTDDHASILPVLR